MRFLVVGCGSIGRRHIANLKALGIPGDDIELLDISTRAQFAAQSDFGVRAHFRWRDVDAAIISTPAEPHSGYALEAMGVLGAVFIEKPLATTVEDCGRIIEAADKAGVVAMVGHQWRFHPNVQRARDFGPDECAFTLASKATNTGAGVVLEYGTHAVDIQRYVMGEVSEVTHRVIDKRSGHGFMLGLKHERGLSSSLLSDNAPTPKRHLFCRRGTHAEYFDLNDGIDEMYRKEMEHFVECVCGNAKPMVTLRDGLEAVRWALAER